MTKKVEKYETGYEKDCVVTYPSQQGQVYFVVAFQNWIATIT